MWNSVKRVARNGLLRKPSPIPAGSAGSAGSKMTSESQTEAWIRSFEDESTLHRARERSNSLINPCALKSSQCSHNLAISSTEALSPKEVFTHYVEFHRDNTGTQWNGFLTCPFNGCLNSYPSKCELLKHIQVCKRFSAGEYWCPLHLMFEQFFVTSKTPSGSSWPSKGLPFRQQIRKLCSPWSKTKSLSELTSSVEYTYGTYDYEGSSSELPGVDRSYLLPNTPWSEPGNNNTLPELQTIEVPQLLDSTSSPQELEDTQRQELPADMPSTTHPQYCDAYRESPEPRSPVSSLGAGDYHASNFSGFPSLDYGNYSVPHGQVPSRSLELSTPHTLDNTADLSVWNTQATVSANQAIPDSTSSQLTYSYIYNLQRPTSVPNPHFSEIDLSSANGRVQTEDTMPLFPYDVDLNQQRWTSYGGLGLSPTCYNMLSENNTVGNNYFYSDSVDNPQYLSHHPDTPPLSTPRMAIKKYSSRNGPGPNTISPPLAVGYNAFYPSVMENRQHFTHDLNTPPYTPPTTTDKYTPRNEYGSNTSSPPQPAILRDRPVSSSLLSPPASYTESDPVTPPKRRLVPKGSITPRKRQNTSSTTSTTSPTPSTRLLPQLPKLSCQFEGCKHKSGGEKLHYQKSNLQRHYRTKHCGVGKKWLCPFPGCKTEITDRFDNLESHWKSFHGGRPPKEKDCKFRPLPRTSC